MAVTPSDAAKLLGVAAAFDRRTVGEAEAIAWADALHDLDPNDCQLAIRSHYHDSAVFVMPSHVRQRVKAIRETAAERAHRAMMREAIEAPRDPDGSHRAYLAAVAGLRQVRPVSEYDRGRADAEAVARSVRCPHCKAAAGRPCVNEARGGAVRALCHPSRADLAAAAGGAG